MLEIKNKNIILLGFRYTGKSAIGQAIAEVNKLTFVDLDLEVERKLQKTIPQITNNGESWVEFRRCEFELFEKFITQKNTVLSCGGGIGVNEFYGKEEVSILHQNQDCLKILLEIDQKTLQKREQVSTRRPQINQNSNMRLWETRKELYELIDYDIKVDSSSDTISHAIKNKSLCCVVGYPVWHSLSPKIHNACYKDLKIEDNFTYTKIELKPSKFPKISTIIKALNLKGISITSPYKEEIIKYLDHIEDIGKKIDGVNTVVHHDSQLYGYNTDAVGVKNAIANNCDITNKHVAIFGSGGAAKAAAIGLLECTKNITLFSRSPAKNHTFAKELQIANMSLQDFRYNKFDIIINATTVGLNDKKSILSKNQISPNHTILDMVYSPLKTKLLSIAKKKHAKIIYGTEMLIYQAIEQFKLYTGRKPNANIIRQAVYENHRHCIVVVGTTISEFLQNLRKAQKLSNFVELRTDYIQNLSKHDILAIASALSKDAIFTCRMKKDGGMFLDHITKHKELIEYAMSLNTFTYFDIDLSNIRRYNKLVKQFHVQIILSYHNFSGRPTVRQYQQILAKMDAFTPCVKKIAANVFSQEDLSNMLQILTQNTDSNIIFAPMTESKFYRILALELGSWTNFFCLDKASQTAMGQIPFIEYKKIAHLLS